MTNTLRRGLGTVTALTALLVGCSSHVELAGDREGNQTGDGADGGLGGNAGQTGNGSGQAGTLGEPDGGVGGGATGRAGSPWGGGAGEWGVAGRAGSSVGGYGGAGNGSSYGATGNVGGYGGGGAWGAAGSGAAGDPGTGASGGTSAACLASGCGLIQLRAHGEAGGTGFIALPGEEVVECFGFQVAMAVGAHATSFAPIIDNAIVLHDLTLVETTAAQTPGSADTCGASGADGMHLYSWAPGMGSVVDANVPLGSGSFVLSTHYVNTTSEPQTDMSGVALCVCSN